MPTSRPDPEPYQVLARRFRPRTFAEVVGQDAILQSLRSALQSGRVPHAFLFAGSRGVGKTTLARILARCLNCERGPTPDPCGTCELCRAILDGSSTDVVEIDAASNNSVEDIRDLRDRVGFASMRSRFKVYILDEVHMLSRPAFNAFLKTLEEPPPNVVFVLATTEPGKVPETVRSRCQVLLFRRVGDGDIVQRLRMIVGAEGVQVAEDVLAEIAGACRGGMRDAETALERVLPVARERGAALDLETYRGLVQRVGADRAVEVAAALLQGEAAPALRFAAELHQSGMDEREALGELVEVLRWCLLLKVDGADSALVPVHGAMRARLQAMAAGVDDTRLEAAIQAGLLGRERIRRLDDRGVVLELSLLRMASAGRLQSLSDLLAGARTIAPAPVGAPVSAPPVSAPVSAPAAPAPAAGGLLGALVARLGTSRQLLKATLEQCRIEGPDAEGRVQVRLEAARKMHRDRLSSEGVQQEVRELLAEVLGRKVAVEFQVAAAPEAAAPPPGPAPEPGPTARAVLEKFGGRMLGRSPDEDPGLPGAGPDEAATGP
jgi:DNA polymerase-3 subunit gamma/tau